MQSRGATELDSSCVRVVEISFTHISTLPQREPIAIPNTRRLFAQLLKPLLICSSCVLLVYRSNTLITQCDFSHGPSVPRISRWKRQEACRGPARGCACSPHTAFPRAAPAPSAPGGGSVDGVVYVRGLFFQRTQVNAGYSSSLQAFSYHYLSTHLSRKIFIRGPLSFLSSF